MIRGARVRRPACTIAPMVVITRAALLIVAALFALGAGTVAQPDRASHTHLVIVVDGLRPDSGCSGWDSEASSFARIIRCFRPSRGSTDHRS